MGQPRLWSLGIVKSPWLIDIACKVYRVESEINGVEKSTVYSFNESEIAVIKNKISIIS